MPRIRVGTIQGGVFRAVAPARARTAEATEKLELSRTRRQTERLRQAMLAAGLIKTGAQLFGPAVGAGISRLTEPSLEEKRQREVDEARSRAAEEAADRITQVPLTPEQKARADQMILERQLPAERQGAEAMVARRPRVPMETELPAQARTEPLPARAPSPGEAAPATTFRGQVTGEQLPGMQVPFAPTTPSDRRAPATGVRDPRQGVDITQAGVPLIPESSAELQARINRMQFEITQKEKAVRALARLARQSDDRELKVQVAQRIKDLQLEISNTRQDMARAAAGRLRFEGDVLPVPGPGTPQAPQAAPPLSDGRPISADEQSIMGANSDFPMVSDAELQRMATNPSFSSQFRLAANGALARRQAGQPAQVAPAAPAARQPLVGPLDIQPGQFGAQALDRPLGVTPRPEPEGAVPGVPDVPTRAAAPVGQAVQPDLGRQIADARQDVELAGMAAGARAEQEFMNFNEAAALAKSDPSRMHEALAALRRGGYVGVRASSLTDLISGDHLRRAEKEIRDQVPKGLTTQQMELQRAKLEGARERTKAIKAQAEAARARAGRARTKEQREKELQPIRKRKAEADASMAEYKRDIQKAKADPKRLGELAKKAQDDAKKAKAQADFWDAKAKAAKDKKSGLIAQQRKDLELKEARRKAALARRIASLRSAASKRDKKDVEGKLTDKQKASLKSFTDAVRAAQKEASEAKKARDKLTSDVAKAKGLGAAVASRKLPAADKRVATAQEKLRQTRKALHDQAKKLGVDAPTVTETNKDE